MPEKAITVKIRLSDKRRYKKLAKKLGIGFMDCVHESLVFYERICLELLNKRGDANEQSKKLRN